MDREPRRRRLSSLPRDPVAFMDEVCARQLGRIRRTLTDAAHRHRERVESASTLHVQDVGSKQGVGLGDWRATIAREYGMTRIL